MEHKIDFAVGGQAVIEGVMMRSPNFIAVAVRKKNKSIKVKNYPFCSLTAKIRLLKIPIVRGIVNLFEMMAMGMRALNFSANEYADDFETEEEKTEEKKKNPTFEIVVAIFSFVISFAIAIFLFKFVPLAITEWLRSVFPFIAKHYIIFNLIDGLIRILIFIGYIFALSIMKSFRRIFEYHGAEHKSIYAYEKGLALTAENAKKQSRFHPRCGTSFIVIVFLISIAIYTLIPRNPVFLLNLSQRLALLPLIAGICYEILKWSAKHRENSIVKLLVAPGLWTQRITTKEPDDSQLEVALKALRKTLEMEKLSPR